MSINPFTLSIKVINKKKVIYYIPSYLRLLSPILSRAYRTFLDFLAVASLIRHFVRVFTGFRLKSARQALEGIRPHIGYFRICCGAPVECLVPCNIYHSGGGI